MRHWVDGKRNMGHRCKNWIYELRHHSVKKRKAIKRNRIEDIRRTEDVKLPRYLIISIRGVRSPKY